MRNHTSMNISLISEQILSLIAEGARAFKVEENVTQCTKCPLSQTRKKVLVSNSKIQKNYFVLSEYADAKDEEEENSVQLFSNQSSSGIILNLTDKLGITPESHFAFAVKCVPHKCSPETGLRTCVVANLLKEIQLIQPNVILCFGTRAFYALSSIDPNLFSQIHMPKNGNFANLQNAFHFELNRKMEIYLLPTAQELKHNPKWRASVWAQLSHFKKNIDS